MQKCSQNESENYLEKSRRKVSQNYLKMDSKNIPKTTKNAKKHIKTTKEKKGGIVEKENFINISNLSVIDSKKKEKKTEAKK